MAYKDNPNVAMFMVYVREAHPANKKEEDKRAAGKKLEGQPDIAQHKTMDDRVLAALACRKGLNLSLPVLIDTMDGVVERAYQGVPAATAIIDLEGKIVFHSRGPHGVQPKEADRVLKSLLEKKPARPD